MSRNRQKEEIPKTELTANELTNVKDVKGCFLYSRDNHIFGYLKVNYFNLDLLSQEEKEVLTQKLSLSFEGDRNDFDYMTFPREIDLDDYKLFLKKRYQGEDKLGKRKILSIMIQEAAELSTSGENYEHQHYIKLWVPIGNNLKDSQKELSGRLEDFKDRYESIGIHCEILNEKEIIKLCNLFGNSQQVAYMTYENTVYTAIPQIR
ncbi:MAG: hypothetical protein LIP16_20575 [Clostridium sp.]|nr:hypothetical protein [Clostridium sp.]